MFCFGGLTLNASRDFDVVYDARARARVPIESTLDSSKRNNVTPHIQTVPYILQHKPTHH